MLQSSRLCTIPRLFQACSHTRDFVSAVYQSGNFVPQLFSRWNAVKPSLKSLPSSAQLNPVPCKNLFASLLHNSHYCFLAMFSHLSPILDGKPLWSGAWLACSQLHRQYFTTAMCIFINEYMSKWKCSVLACKEEAGSGKRFAEMTETNGCKTRKLLSERRGLCWALRPAARGLAELRGAETCQVGRRLCECPGGEKQRVCALNEEPGCLN